MSRRIKASAWRGTACTRGSQLRIDAEPNRQEQVIPAKQEKIRVLVADDQPHILEAVELLLAPQGIDVDCVRSPQLLLEALGERDYDVLLIDLNYTRDTTSGQEGLDLLARIQEFDARLPVIVMTAWGNIDLAVESHQARRARFYPEAMGERAAALADPRPRRAAPGAAPRPPAGNGESPAARRRACRSLWLARPPCSRCWS